MAQPERGKDIGNMEYGRIPYAGRYMGDMEYGRVPGIGWSPEIKDPIDIEGLELLKIIIPKNRYWAADYPKLDPTFEGVVKPRLYGRKAGIIPTCINTETGLYHMGDHAFKEIHSVEVSGETLGAGEYDSDLSAATILIGNTPLLTPDATYYFTLEGIAIDAANYLKFYAEATPAGWTRYYTINAAGVWSAAAEDKALSFGMHFRHALSDGDSPVAWVEIPPTGENLAAVGLGDDALRTRIGQKFTAPNIFGKDSYLTFMRICFRKQGNPTGTVKIRIFSGIDDDDLQVGAASKPLWCSWVGGDEGSEYGSTDPNKFYFQTDANWGIREAGKGQVLVEATGRTVSPHTPAEAAMTNIADVVEDVMTDVMGVPSTALDAPAFANLKTNKTEEVSLHMNTEMEFQQFIETAEVGQMWKLIPTLGRLFSPQWFDPTPPVSPLYLRNEDYISFRMYHDLEAVRQIFRIKYDHSPSGGASEVKETESAYARFFYRNEQTMEIDAWLKNSVEVGAVNDNYKAILEKPPLMAVFEVKGHGFDLVPMDRVKLSRDRAMYSGGTLDGVLFRIFRVTKRVSTKTTEIVAVLDSQVSI